MFTSCADCDVSRDLSGFHCQKPHPAGVYSELKTSSSPDGGPVVGMSVPSLT
jgi:hypothetical protein